MIERLAYRLVTRQTVIALLAAGTVIVGCVACALGFPGVAALVSSAGAMVAIYGIRVANDLRRVREVGIKRTQNRLRRRAVLFAVAEVRASEAMRDRSVRWSAAPKAVRYGAN